MNVRIAITSQFRKRSRGRMSARNPRLIDPIRFRNAMNAKSERRTELTARIDLFRSFFSYRRRRAFWRSSRGMSALLFHVPDDEDEPELAQRDHQRHDDVQERQDERRTRLADERHDRHDHDEEQREGDDDRNEGLGEQTEGLHLLPHLELVLLLE